jgi:ribose-phosphate pyrophosphokinase
MSEVLIYALPCSQRRAEGLAKRLSARLPVRLAQCAVRAFPDGESLVELEPPAPGARAMLLCSLDRPDPKVLPLLLAARTLRDLGARDVGLVAPYLAYMRQDVRFRPGQALSAKVFGELLSGYFDWMLTVDPHLHRIHALSEVYSLRARVLHAAPRLAAWIAQQVPAPLIIGPDGESAQWAMDVGARAGAPVVVLAKTRLGDEEVKVSVPDLRRHPGRTPVLVDDIISSGQTLLAAITHLREAGTPAPVCVAVHGLFAGNALSLLRDAGAARIACTDTVDHPAELISLEEDLTQGLVGLLEDGGPRPGRGG